MSNPLSSRTPQEFTVKQGVHSPETSRRSRAVLPGFSDAFGGGTQSIVAVENVSVNVTIPSLAPGSTQVVTAKQGLSTISKVNPATTDIGQVFFANVSASQVPGVILSHPTIQVSTQQGTPIGGSLQPGLPVTNLALNVSMTVAALGATSPGTSTISATCFLVGTSAGNQA